MTTRDTRSTTWLLTLVRIAVFDVLRGKAPAALAGHSGDQSRRPDAPQVVGAAQRNRKVICVGLVVIVVLRVLFYPSVLLPGLARARLGRFALIHFWASRQHLLLAPLTTAAIFIIVFFIVFFIALLRALVRISSLNATSALGSGGSDRHGRSSTAGFRSRN